MIRTHSEQILTPIGSQKCSKLSPVSEGRNFSLGGRSCWTSLLPASNRRILVAVVELPWELVSIGVALVPVSRIGEDQLLLPWADCGIGTNELIGKDLSAVISLDVGQLMC